MRIFRRRHCGGLWIALFLIVEAGIVTTRQSRRTPLARLPLHQKLTRMPDAVLSPDLRREVVAFTSEENPGTNIVDAEARALYYVLSDE